MFQETEKGKMSFLYDMQEVDKTKNMSFSGASLQKTSTVLVMANSREQRNSQLYSLGELEIGDSEISLTMTIKTCLCMSSVEDFACVQSV